ncbi:MAG: phosphate acyltransferase PlsX [Planctomycetota bacterium]
MGAARIGLDVLGGDRAPEAILDGVFQAIDPAQETPIDPDRLVLFGDQEAMERAFESRGGNPGCHLVHAPESIGMDEKPGQALRAKQRSSIVLGTGAVKAGQTGAFVSMGNTGAVVGAATLMLRTLPGVRRPAIAVTQNLTGRPVTVLDMGASVVLKPEDLVVYAVMGTILQRDCMGVAQPRVGLLNIGEEESKGTELLQTAHGLLRQAPVRFVGNVEGRDLFEDQADVVVTGSFTGNVVLKLMEGMAGFMLGQIMGALKAHNAAWAPEVLAGLKRQVDYSEYGGALLLGVGGVVVIGHGRSDGRAVRNALGLAARALDAGVNDSIVRGLAAGGAVGA